MLSIDDLSVKLTTPNGVFDVVSSVSIGIERGEVVGLVGESGCGKSMTSLAIMGLLPAPAASLRTGTIVLDGTEITHMAPHARVAAGCGGVSMIFQEPMTSLNPVLKIGYQITEAIRVHDGLTGTAATKRAQELLEMVRMPDAAMQLGSFPHELSGGMRQRVIIAIALACRPQVLIADEPTTALDVTVQSQILSLIRELCDELSMAVLFITHDLGVVAQLADRVLVMYAGRIVETAPVETMFLEPAHPYTRGLLACLPNPMASERRLRTIAGQAPRPHEIGTGCAFAPRCGHAEEACRNPDMEWRQVNDNHGVLCLHPQSGLRAL
ncbi:MAG: ABC transporter ATP-binding protein [Alphaproteobacteria bacterium]